MLVTFEIKSYPNITMFGDVAIRFLKMMGCSGQVPGAIESKDVPAALARLKEAISVVESTAIKDEPDANKDEDDDLSVSMATRAVPLVELMESASRANETVMWTSHTH